MEDGLQAVENLQLDITKSTWTDLIAQKIMETDVTMRAENIWQLFLQVWTKRSTRKRSELCCWRF